MLALALRLCLVSTMPSPELLDKAATDAHSDSLARWYDAYKIYDQALAQEPNNFTYVFQTASVLNLIMSGQTAGGGFSIDGISNRPEDRQLCTMFGPKASELADRAAAMRPNDIEALVQKSVAYSYYAVSFGILEAIARNTVGTIKHNAQAIVDLNPTWDGGLGHFMLGVFNTLAPWPIGSNSDARDYFDLALQAGPRSRRNHYGLGVLLWRTGDKPQARKEFARAVELPCPEPRERALCDFYKRESERVIKLP